MTTLYQMLSGGLTAEEHRVESKQSAAEYRAKAKEEAQYRRDNPPDPHDTLTALGLMENPIGYGANLLNSSLFALEGKGKSALWELTGALPVIGMFTPWLKGLNKTAKVLEDSNSYLKNHSPRSPLISSIDNLYKRTLKYIGVERETKVFKQVTKNPKGAKKVMENADKKVLESIENELDKIIDEGGDEASIILGFKKAAVDAPQVEISKGVSKRVVEDMDAINRQFRDLGSPKTKKIRIL